MIKTKEQLRTDFKKLRDTIDASVRAEENQQIADRLLASQMYKDAKTVFAYISTGSEVKTGRIINTALTDGKKVAVPLCNTDLRTMKAVVINDISQLTIGSYGLFEPYYEDMQILEKSEIDLVIVPALSFDRNRMRIGYGGGYYDKFLADFKGLSVGLCFSCCVTDKLPTEEFDCPVDKVICPTEVV